jgi:hypothetical protein
MPNESACVMISAAFVFVTSRAGLPGIPGAEKSVARTAPAPSTASTAAVTGGCLQA